MALSGQEASKQLAENSFDLILLDIRLPDINGIDLLKDLRKKQFPPHVIIMTGHGTVENAVDAMKNGAFDYLTKPFNDKDILKTVAMACHSRKLIRENLALKKQLYEKFSFDNIIGKSRQIVDIFNKIERVAPLDSTVLLDGESGTGKELFANAIHAHSKRAAHRFLAVDCNTFSSSLLESELFGHVKGAFTGAKTDKPGIFETASHGTLFLDEVANLDQDIQGKLLRVLETCEYKAVGATETKQTHARIIAATNTSLKDMVKEKTFRQDLFYRLNVFPIYIPPLRERRDDIPRLAYHFLNRFCKKAGKQIQGFSHEALDTLVSFDWPGNVRQLKNVVERLVILADSPHLNQNFLRENLEVKTRDTENDPTVPNTIQELKAAKKHCLEHHFGKIEAAFLKQALKKNQGNITRAAKQVGMQRSNFSVLMKKHQIHPPKT
jgi:DNA-binding NtrC family response regulator